MSGACDWFDLVEYVESFDMGINFLEGPQGPPGPPGEAIFIPSVSNDGWISWTNTAGLPNPEPVNIKGPAGSVGVLSIRADYVGGGVGENRGDVSLVGSGCLVNTVYDGRIEISASKYTIGLGQVANERQYSAQNPPPYPVKSVNGETGDVEVPKTVSAALACESISTASGTRNAWPIGSNTPPIGGNLSLAVRNATTGAVHVVWYYSNDGTFEVAATIIGNPPNVGDIIYVTYQA